MPAWLNQQTPLLALAPMQAVTDLPFWTVVRRYGGPDVYFTEYFRVNDHPGLERSILASIDKNPTGRPVVAQMIGNNPAALARTARELQKHPVAAIDLNLGCPAPVVYRKCAGGGLLRDLPRVDLILGALREAVSIPLTVKTRVGFDDPGGFDDLLRVLARHALDLVTVHGRTVAEAYRSDVHYDLIARAVETLPCPVLANGNIHSARKAEHVLAQTGARGLMIGRGAIRNPWIFEQIRQSRRGEEVMRPAGSDLLAYIHALYEAVCSPNFSEAAQVQKMKRYLNFIGLGVDETGGFLHAIRRVNTRGDFFAICEEHLDHHEPMTLEPLPIAFKETDVLAGVH